jgi:hypothetical protein
MVSVGQVEMKQEHTHTHTSTTKMEAKYFSIGGLTKVICDVRIPKSQQRNETDIGLCEYMPNYAFTPIPVSVSKQQTVTCCVKHSLKFRRKKRPSKFEPSNCARRCCADFSRIRRVKMVHASAVIIPAQTTKKISIKSQLYFIEIIIRLLFSMRTSQSGCKEVFLLNIPRSQLFPMRT